MLRYKVCNEFYEGKTRADCKRHIQFQTEFRKSAIAPPQVGSDQGHYDGYSSRIMEKQATSFTNVTASFKYHYSSPLRNKQLTVESKENNWHQIEDGQTNERSNWKNSWKHWSANRQLSNRRYRWGGKSAVETATFLPTCTQKAGRKAIFIFCGGLHILESPTDFLL